MLDLLPPAPAGFYQFPVTPRKSSLLYWMNPGVVWRLGRLARSVWVSEQPDDPIKLIEIVVQPFASGQFADHLWRQQVPDPEVIATLVDPPPEVRLIDPQSYVIKWQRGPAYFTDLTARYDRAIIAVMAVSNGAGDVAPQLHVLAQRVRDKLNEAPRHWSYKVPRLVWQVLLGVGIGLLLWIAGRALGAVAGDTVGSVATLAAIAVVLLYFSVLPRFRRQSRLRQMWREAMINGDRDGTVRRALASIGIHLPADR